MLTGYVLIRSRDRAELQDDDTFLQPCNPACDPAMFQSLDALDDAWQRYIGAGGEWCATRVEYRKLIDNADPAKRRWVEALHTPSRALGGGEKGE